MPLDNLINKRDFIYRELRKNHSRPYMYYSSIDTSYCNKNYHDLLIKNGYKLIKNNSKYDWWYDVYYKKINLHKIQIRINERNYISASNSHCSLDIVYYSKTNDILHLSKIQFPQENYNSMIKNLKSNDDYNLFVGLISKKQYEKAITFIKSIQNVFFCKNIVKDKLVRNFNKNEYYKEYKLNIII